MEEGGFGETYSGPFTFIKNRSLKHSIKINQICATRQLRKVKERNNWVGVSLMRSFQKSVHQWENAATLFIQFELQILELLSVACFLQYIMVL